MLKWILFIAGLTVVSAEFRPLHVLVDQIKAHYGCEVEYPEEIRDRSSLKLGLRNLQVDVAGLFYKESWSVQTRSGKTMVQVLRKEPSLLGELKKRNVIPKDIVTKSGKASVDSNSLLVSFDPSLSHSQKASILSQRGLEYDSRALSSPVMLVGVSKELEKTYKELLQQKGVRVSYNHIVSPASGNLEKAAVGLAQVGTAQIGTSEVQLSQTDIQDPHYAQQWGYQYVNAFVGLEGQRVHTPKIVVLDTGVNTSHQDLPADRILNRDFSDSMLRDNDTNGHGTGVVGLIGAALNNLGIVGLIQTDIISIKVFDH